MTFTRALATNNYGPAKFIVDGTTTANGTHSTIAAALTSASSGDCIFIRPGTYTENLTLKAGVNLTAYGSDSSFNGTGLVIISGTCTLTAAGSVTISGIQLQTNSAALLAVTGTVASVVNLNNCYLNCSNNTGITFSTSSSSGAINIRNCGGNLGTTGIAIFSHSSAGVLSIYDSDFSNSGGSSTASTASAGSLTLRRSVFFNPITTSSTANSDYDWCGFNTLVQNTTALTQGGSGGSNVNNSYVLSGTASAISISNTTGVRNCIISSSNTNAITGAGTINHCGLGFSSSSSTINTTTKTDVGTLQGNKGYAPSAGFLGEQTRATVASGSAVTVNNLTATNITSISLTAGIWDVSAVGVVGNGITTGTSAEFSISTTSATRGTSGDNAIQIPCTSTAANDVGITIPSYRLTLSSTTTVYLVAFYSYGAGTGKGYGRISGTRVG